MYDIQQIKARINCVDVAQRCGLTIVKSGDRCTSPIRNGAKNKTSFYVEDDFWFDFGDGRGGDVIDLLAELKFSGDKGAAIRELAKITGVADDDGQSEDWVKYTQNLCNQVAYWQTRLTEDDRNYLRSRGISDDTIVDLKFGRTDEGRLCIPYMKNGYVAYYCTRYLPGGAYPESKYRKQRKDGYCENIVWGLGSLSYEGDTLVIAEGAFDAISFYQEKYPVISAITGFFSKEQISTVISTAKSFKNVFIVYDNDEKTSNAGAKFTERMATLLSKHRIPFTVGTVPHPYHDISEYYAAGGDLSAIISSAEDGITYLALKYREFEDLSRFIFSVARYTKRTKLDTLLSQLKKSSDFDPKLLTDLFRAATTAPPETIVADEILRSHNLVFIHAEGFYEYINGVWKRQPRGVIKGYADRSYGEFSTAQRINAIANILETRALRDITFNTQPVWNFINGTLELDTGTFREHNPNDYCSFQARYPYNPRATYDAWTQFISDVTCDDPKTAELLQFIPGYVFFPDCSLEKIFVLTGSGGNGKSKYLEVLRQLFGAENCTHITPRGLLDKFQRINLKNSLVNLAGEIKSDMHDAEEYMKQIASGETLSACFKSQDYVNFTPRTKLVFACNGQLSSGDTSEGLERRLVIIDFKMRFVDYPDPNNPYERQKNTNILDAITEELQSGGVFNWAYAGYKLLRTVGYFTETNDQTELLADFKRASNPILVFWEDEYSDSTIHEISYDQIYADYIKWCATSGEKPVSSQKFHMELKNLVRGDYETVIKSVRIDGKPRKQRWYVLQDYR